jgi:hypothetical protein
MKQREINHCPICSNAGKELDANAKYYVEPFDEVIELHYSFCEDCQFVFCTTPLIESDLDQYYTRSKRFFDPLQRVADLQHAESQANFVLRYLPIQTELKLLEIGPFRDYFLASMLAKTGGIGYFSELNQVAVERLSQQGYTKVNWQLQEKFDLVGLRHVLEHIVDLRDFMQFISTRLNPEGIIFIEVPDLTHTELAYVDGLQFEHVNYFTQQSVLKLAKITGFQVIGLESCRIQGSSTSSNQVLRVALKLLPRLQLTELNDYLQNSLSVVSKITELLSQHTQVAFYGAGTLTQMLLPYLIDKQRPLAIFDTDIQKQGVKLLGIPVESPEYLTTGRFSMVFITVLGPEEVVMEKVSKQGFKRENIFCISSFLNHL